MSKIGRAIQTNGRKKPKTEPVGIIVVAIIDAAAAKMEVSRSTVAEGRAKRTTAASGAYYGPVGAGAAAARVVLFVGTNKTGAFLTVALQRVLPVPLSALVGGLFQLVYGQPGQARHKSTTPS